ncbi:MAG: hypothetical protein EOP87_11160 [Verrucomicrobiaceae bacterium]|nr:MAG: hypothetical protein EOP87_11160 [Verrucomicrobiaceae bacterium]
MTTGGILAIAMLLVTLLLAKHLVVNLSLLNGYNERRFNFREARTSHLNDTDTELVSKAIRAAAGAYTGFYQIEFPIASDGGTKSLGISMTSGARKAQSHSEAHLKAFGQRLRLLLPPRIRIEASREDLHGNQVDSRRKRYHTLAVTAVPWVLAAASVLAAFTGRRLFFGSLACGMVATVILSSVQLWPAPPMIPPSLADRPPLPLTPLPRPAAPEMPDAQGAVTMFQRIQEAARSGDLAAVKLGMSEGVMTTLNETNGWQEVVDWLIEQKIFKPDRKLKCHRTSEDEPWGTSLYVQSAREGGPLDMIFEDGEWRIDEQPWLR